MKRRGFLAACATLLSGCIGSGDDFPPLISAKPVNESEINESVKVWDYNDSEISGYEDMRKAIRRSYNRTVESGEPELVTSADKNHDEIEGIEERANYSSKYGRKVMYVRYRGKVFRIVFDDN